MSILPSSSSSGEQPIGTRSVTKICVVKRCLNSTIRDDLPFEAKRKLLDYIDHASEAISRMIRRSSIVLLYYVERLMEDEDSMQTNVLPDWDDLPDSYWKSWLRVGKRERHAAASHQTRILERRARLSPLPLQDPRAIH